MAREVVCHAIYYFIFIESDPISICGAPRINKERPKKPSFRTGYVYKAQKINIVLGRGGERVDF